MLAKFSMISFECIIPEAPNVAFRRYFGKKNAKTPCRCPKTPPPTG
jgi:hypothetical protein